VNSLAYSPDIVCATQVGLIDCGAADRSIGRTRVERPAARYVSQPVETTACNVALPIESGDAAEFEYSAFTNGFLQWLS
jgi:hypothetical protein